MGKFEEARIVFDESIDECDSVSTFGILYAAYLKFEQTIADLTEDEEDLERLEKLLDNRAFLLSNVILKQNPNNVNEWLNRIQLCEGQIESTISTYTEALRTVQSQQALGKLSKLWIGFAKFYEQYDEIENSNVVYFKATQQEFRSVEELSHVYCAWAEMHVRHNNVESSIKIMRHAVSNK